MTERNISVIKCPVCGQEYLPAEIYVPKAFFGNPKEVIKDDAGQVSFYTGSDMDLEEEYICDNCNSKFKITAEVNFNTELINKSESIEEYVTTFNRPKKLELTEDQLF